MLERRHAITGLNTGTEEYCLPGKCYLPLMIFFIVRN
jgi:hypothetical protein